MAGPTSLLTFSEASGAPNEATNLVSRSGGMRETSEIGEIARARVALRQNADETRRMGGCLPTLATDAPAARIAASRRMTCEGDRGRLRVATPAQKGLTAAMPCVRARRGCTSKRGGEVREMEKKGR